MNYIQTKLQEALEKVINNIMNNINRNSNLENLGGIISKILPDTSSQNGDIKAEYNYAFQRIDVYLGGDQTIEIIRIDPWEMEFSMPINPRVSLPVSEGDRVRSIMQQIGYTRR